MPSVAIIGLGAFGIVTLKNLLEEGYDATAFDKNPYLSGLWHYTADNRVSALQSTIVNAIGQFNPGEVLPFHSLRTHFMISMIPPRTNLFITSRV